MVGRIDGRHDDGDADSFVAAVVQHFVDEADVHVAFLAVEMHFFAIFTSIFFDFRFPNISPPMWTIVKSARREGFVGLPFEIVFRKFSDGERLQRETFQMLHDTGLLVNAHVDAMSVAVHHVFMNTVVKVELLISESPNEMSETSESGSVMKKRHTVVGRHFSRERKVKRCGAVRKNCRVNALVGNGTADNEGAEFCSSRCHHTVFEDIYVWNAAYAPLKRTSGEKYDEREKTDGCNESFHIDLLDFSYSI